MEDVSASAACAAGTASSDVRTGSRVYLFTMRSGVSADSAGADLSGRPFSETYERLFLCAARRHFVALEKLALRAWRPWRAADPFIAILVSVWQHVRRRCCDTITIR